MSAPTRREIYSIRRAILRWYARQRRDLPWRSTRDPYAILVSEVMLQQTQAARVVERYPRFMARFPHVSSLASASEAEVLTEWSGLGYNRRALALHRAARTIEAVGWPLQLQALAGLPGVGPYTARAIASLAFGQPVGSVDTNVRRWLTRRFGLAAGRRSVGSAELQRIADALATGRRARPPDSEEVAVWTQASIEVGATVCRARRPECDACPVARGCPERRVARHVRVPRQAPFPGSLRAYRGAVMRALARAPDHALAREQLALRAAESRFLGGGFDERRVILAIEGLARDGLAHAEGGLVRLGPAPDKASSAATIPA